MLAAAESLLARRTSDAELAAALGLDDPEKIGRICARVLTTGFSGGAAVAAEKEGEGAERLRQAAGNLRARGVEVLPARGLNVYSILRKDWLIMSRDAVDRVAERLRTTLAQQQEEPQQKVMIRRSGSARRGKSRP